MAAFAENTPPAASPHPTLRLVGESHEAAVLSYAASAVTHFIGFAGRNVQAARACTLNLHDILGLVEDGFNPARATFYRMRAAVEMLYGEEGLPKGVRCRAEELGLMGPMHR